MCIIIRAVSVITRPIVVWKFVKEENGRYYSPIQPRYRLFQSNTRSFDPGTILEYKIGERQWSAVPGIYAYVSREAIDDNNLEGEPILRCICPVGSTILWGDLGQLTTSDIIPVAVEE